MRKFQLRITVLVFLSFWIGITVNAKEETQFFKADNPNFQYMGRVEMENGKAAYNWPGVAVSVGFTGKILGISFSGGEGNYFNLWVDDNPALVIHAENDSVFWYPNLKEGTHHFRLVKRTEGFLGIAHFNGAFTEKDKRLEKAEPLPERKILFIGNSITCGYGTEGKDKTEKFKPFTENCEKSYAPIISRAMGAQYQLTSHSGLGMVRNYGDKQKRSVKEKPMPLRLEWLFDNDSTKLYDLQKFIPDAVVINLGTNDYSTQPHPDDQVFIDEGVQLINDLLERFPGVKVFCLTGPMINEPCFSNTKKIVETVRNSKDTKDVVFVGIPVDLLNTENDLGSDYHPSYRGQAKSARMVVPVMANVLGWDYSTAEIDKIVDGY